MLYGLIFESRFAVREAKVKHQTNLRLTTDARKWLAREAGRLGVSQADVVEMCRIKAERESVFIQECAERDGKTQAEAEIEFRAWWGL